MKAQVVLRAEESIFEVQTLSAIATTKNEELYVKSFKYEARAFQQFLAGGTKLATSARILPEVELSFTQTRDAKRLRMTLTNDGAML